MSEQERHLRQIRTLRRLADPTNNASPNEREMAKRLITMLEAKYGEGFGIPNVRASSNTDEEVDEDKIRDNISIEKRFGLVHVDIYEEQKRSTSLFAPRKTRGLSITPPFYGDDFEMVEGILGVKLTRAEKEKIIELCGRK